MLVSIIYLLIVVLLLVSMWKVYEKAGRQGWEGIIPIYNLYVMLQIINRPWWWLLIMIFVPIANIIFSIIALKEFLEKFGKGIGFTIATIFFPFITFPMLAFEMISSRMNNSFYIFRINRRFAGFHLSANSFNKSLMISCTFTDHPRNYSQESKANVSPR
ncbi:MAG: DUF5684 domain-containing protein [Butyricimonas faecihominis]